MSAVASMASEVAATKELFVIDGSSFIFRAYYQSINQDPRYNVRPSDDLPTGAVRLFLGKMLQIVEKGAAGVRPTHLIMAFDTSSRAGRRRDIFPEYKATRRETPVDLKPQMPFMRHAVRALGITSVEEDRYEADDLIATYTRLAVADGFRVTVISADKDLMQLVGDAVTFYDFESGTPGKPGYRPERLFDLWGVRERWLGLEPHQIGDAMALIGDTSDNIPGVDGIALKTAAQLIGDFGSLEELLARTAEIKQPKRRSMIDENVEQIRLSRQLVELDSNAPVKHSLDAFELGAFDARKLLAFTHALELTGVTKRVAKNYNVDPSTVVADPALTAKVATSSPGDVVVPIDLRRFQITGTAQRLREWCSAIAQARQVVVDVVSDRGAILGFGLATGPGQATYVPVGHEEAATLFGGRHEGQLELKEAIEALRPVFADDGILKIGHDVKSAWKLLHGHGLAAGRFDDTMLMSYALDAGRSSHAIEDLALRKLRHHMRSLDDVTGTGRAKVELTSAKPESVLVFAAERAEMIVRMHRELSPRLTDGPRSVYETLELPLVPVLRVMEGRGVAVDRAELARLSIEFGATMARLDAEIHQLAGEDFDLASPKQTGEILFGKLGLPGATRTATGQWATRASILDELAVSGHRIAAGILEWRGVAKLKSTYSDALQVHARKGDDRVYTTFAMAATTTGRLASFDPNLQNIPVRTEDGRRIRYAFIAAPGRVLISADYSQIELRILAHMANVPELQDAFARGVDIHALTASEMFGVSIEGMDPAVRRSAKAINFGIVYGISAFGLANQLGIPREDAGAYIKRYFERFPGILTYMEETKQKCADLGYVETMFGRQCHFPQIRVLTGSEKNAVERAAINAPIQGSAADVIRRAMIRMEPELAMRGHAGVDMLLQVHDELIFEADEGAAEAALPVIREVMEGACAPELNLSVPLTVEAGIGANWGLAH